MTPRWTPKQHSSDVLVVGAGPAGMAAAERLALGGARVTLLDRHQSPGRKACGGGLTRSSWSLLGLDPDLPDYGAETWREIEVCSPLGRITISQTAPQMMTFDRAVWTAERLRSLKKIGVEIALGERFLRFDDTSRDTAFTSRGKRTFGFLIGADGANSRVRKLMGLDRRLSVRGWQIIVSRNSAFRSNLRVDCPIVWFDPRLFKSGYGWAFPYRDTLRVGCGASSATLSAGDLKNSFFKLLKKKSISPERGWVQAGSIGCDYLGHRFGRRFLVGDAAGLASPLTGEGIYQALVSGQEVAREILERNYRSTRIARLAFRHRRTQEALGPSFLHSTLFSMAPFLLRFGPLRREAWERYVF